MYIIYFQPTNSFFGKLFPVNKLEHVQPIKLKSDPRISIINDNKANNTDYAFSYSNSSNTTIIKKLYKSKICQIT